MDLSELFKRTPLKKRPLKIGKSSEESCSILVLPIVIVTPPPPPPPPSPPPPPTPPPVEPRVSRRKMRKPLKKILVHNRYLVVPSTSFAPEVKQEELNVDPELIPEAEINEGESQQAVEMEPQQAVEMEPQQAVDMEVQQAVDMEPQQEVDMEPQQAVEMESHQAVEMELQQAVEMEPQQAVEMEPQQAVEIELQEINPQLVMDVGVEPQQMEVVAEAVPNVPVVDVPNQMRAANPQRPRVRKVYVWTEMCLTKQEWADFDYAKKLISDELGLRCNSRCMKGPVIMRVSVDTPPNPNPRATCRRPRKAKRQRRA